MTASPRIRLTALLALLAVSSLALPARAQDAPPTADGPQPPPLSRECQTPGISIAGDVPLPHVTNAMRLRRSIRILAIGGSGKGGKSGADSAYQELIEGVLEKTIPGTDVQIIDRGVSGELARDAADRIKTEVALTKPDLVLWQLGTHDALMHVPVGEFKTTVRETLVWLKERDTDVVVVGLHYLRSLTKDPHYQAIRQSLTVIGDELKVLRIGRYEAMQVIDQARRSGTGPLPNEFTTTDAGYSCLAEYVVRAVTSQAFSRPVRLPRK